MKKAVKKSLAVVLAALLVSAAGAVLAGCGCDKKESGSSSGTVSATSAKAATDASKQQSSVTSRNQDTESQQNDGSSAETVYVDSDGYIDEQEAIANVKSIAGTGAQIISCEKGVSPDGAKAWVVVVQPISATDSTETVTYYSGYGFCYAETKSDGGDTESSADSDGYIDEQEAIANVRAIAGTGAQIISYEKGVSPDGLKAWVVVVQPVSASAAGETVTYYSGYQFCYPADSGE